MIIRHMTRLGIVVVLFVFCLSVQASNAIDISQLPDPTRSSTSQELTEPSYQAQFRLQAILHSDQRRSAIINGQVRTIGTWIGKHQITDIRPDTVILSKHGHKKILRLSEAIKIKQPGTKKTGTK